MSDLKHELDVIRAQAEVELQKLEATCPAKDVAGRAIGEHGLFYIMLIVAIGVGSSLVLDKDKIAAVMGLLEASLTALISMFSAIAGLFFPLPYNQEQVTVSKGHATTTKRS